MADGEAASALDHANIELVTPSSVSSVKAATKRFAHRRFMFQIYESTKPATKAYRSINPEVKIPILRNLSRLEASTLTNLRLNVYSHCPFMDVAYCAYCEMDCPLTNTHYLVTCPVTSCKHNMLDKLSIDNLDLNEDLITQKLLNLTIKDPTPLLSVINRYPPRWYCGEGHRHSDHNINRIM